MSTSLPPEVLLHELDEILRSRPEDGVLIRAENGGAEWLGRMQAVLANWPHLELTVNIAVGDILSGAWVRQAPGLRNLNALVSRARHELLIRTSDHGTKVIAQGEQFNYFDELRKIIQRARVELFFVDPFLNEEFVSRYLAYVPDGVTVRMMGRENMRKLLPAVEMMRTQRAMTMEARSGSGFHDRYVFVDRGECIQSGNSFHQGGRLTPTALIPILDAAPAMLQTYEHIWSAAS